MDYPKSQNLHQGKFTDGDPITGIPASIASADHINAVYDEIHAAIVAGGLTPSTDDLAQLATSIGNQVRSKRLFEVSGTADAIILTTPAGKQLVTILNDYDEFSFIVASTNTDLVTVTIDSMSTISINNIISANQVYAGALVTLMYQDGALYLIDQINPKTGHAIEDIGKLIIDTTDVLNRGEVALNGAELSRETHRIAWEKIRATSNLIDQASKDADPITYGGYYGEGDGSTTFTLPIVGGEFIRMYDNGRGVDAGRGFAEFKSYSFENHVHSHYDAQGTLQEYQLTAGNSAIYTTVHGPAATVPNALNTGSAKTGNFGGETRPRSIAYFAKTRL